MPLSQQNYQQEEFDTSVPIHNPNKKLWLGILIGFLIGGIFVFGYSLILKENSDENNQEAQIKLQLPEKPTTTEQSDIKVEEENKEIEIKGEKYEKFREDILGIEFYYPKKWGVINGSLFGSKRDPKSSWGGYAYNFSFDGKGGASALGYGRITAGGRSTDYSEGRGAYIADFSGFNGRSVKDICSSFNASVCEEINKNIISMVVVPKYEDICIPNPGQYPFSKVVVINLPDNPIIQGLVFEDRFLSDKLNKELYGNILGDNYERCYKVSDVTKKTFNDKASEILQNMKIKTADQETMKNIEMFDYFVNSISFYEADTKKIAENNGVLDKSDTFSTDIYFSKEIQGKISLYSPKVETNVEKNIWCGAPVGSVVHKGKFKLLFKESELELGEMTFAENSCHDGTLRIEKLNPNSNQDFIIIPQYATCSLEKVKIYGYDFTSQKLIQYKFKNKDGRILDEIYVGLGSSERLNLEVLISKDFIAKGYNTSSGYFSEKWRFNSKENIFKEIDFQEGELELFKILELEGGFAKDKNNLYRDGKIIPGNFDLNSITLIKSKPMPPFQDTLDIKLFYHSNPYDRVRYFADKNHVYDLDGVLLEGVDPKTFETFCHLNPYSRDKNHVYYKNILFKEADTSTFQLVQADTYNLAKDKNNVYYKDKIVPNADPNTIRFLGGTYSQGDYYFKDKNNVYKGINILKDISPEGFRLLPHHYAKNNDVVYHYDEIINEADSGSFEILADSYAKDKNHVYYKRNIIKYADPQTFEVSVTQPWFARDKNKIYKYGQIVNEYYPGAF